MLKVQDFSCLIFSFFKATLFFTTIASLLAVFQNCDQTETAFLLTALHVTLTQGQRQICTDWILRPCEHHIGPGWPIAFFISYFSQETPIEALKMVKFDFMVRRWGVWWDVWPQCGIIFTVHCVVLERKSERKKVRRSCGHVQTESECSRKCESLAAAALQRSGSNLVLLTIAVKAEKVLTVIVTTYIENTLHVWSTFSFSELRLCSTHLAPPDDKRLADECLRCFRPTWPDYSLQLKWLLYPDELRLSIAKSDAALLLYIDFYLGLKQYTALCVHLQYYMLKNPLQLQNKNSKTSHGIRKFELDEVDRFVSGLKKKKTLRIQWR